jgi:hypothetical protein
MTESPTFSSIDWRCRSTALALVAVAAWPSLAACSRAESGTNRAGSAAPPAKTVVEELCPQNAGASVQVLGLGRCVVPRLSFYGSDRCPTTGPRFEPPAAGPGMKIGGIHPGSVYEACGFRNGDVWQKVNDVALTPEAVLAAYQQLKQASTLEISLLRDGRPLSIRVDLR